MIELNSSAWPAVEVCVRPVVSHVPEAVIVDIKVVVIVIIIVIVVINVSVRDVVSVVGSVSCYCFWIGDMRIVNVHTMSHITNKIPVVVLSKGVVVVIVDVVTITIIPIIVTIIFILILNVIIIVVVVSPISSLHSCQ